MSTNKTTIQDNPRATLEFCKYKMISKINWPSQGTDLNPIEHLYYNVEREIRQKLISDQTRLNERIEEA
jgi:hypothetical protein